ncbi:glycerophosphodiester phosphodiesterase [Actinokineospora pegani]|uniref:glycerophosphodiester phosphodiesterase n=1 Tax=Actinokineospora pegani TaxID=2654637 RepID=UPI0012EA6090|nr:glycerophosphodiester phosphodiesterase [Actinokineospora pegani]
MDANRIFGPRPVLLGHRGCGRGVVDGHVENTLESFLAAAEAGVDWVEVDVRRTADDHLVVAHDPTDDDGVFYADLTGEQAAARGVLRLADLLSALPHHIGVDFDVKTSMEDATRSRARSTMGRLGAIARRESRVRPTLISSFDAGALDIAREVAPGVPRGLLTWLEFPIDQAVASAAHLDVQVLAPHWGSLRPAESDQAPLPRPLEYVVDTVHASGREFLAWCPTLKFAKTLLDAGVDALCVNNVPKAVATLALEPV